MPRLSIKAFKALWLRVRPPRMHVCVICGRACGGYLPYRGGWEDSPRAMRALGVVGSDLGNFECPWCGAHDRERHLLLYMRAVGLWDELPGLDVLHFAPERRLSPLLRQRGMRSYRQVDLIPTEAGIDRMDIQAMDLPDASVDLLIANHVLEHVDDDSKALAEIGRVLRPLGHAILQVPYCPKLTATLSDPGIDDPRSRREVYGQEDHVRLYGGNVFEWFASACGLEFVGGQHAELLPEVDPEKLGVNRAEPFFLFRKPESRS